MISLLWASNSSLLLLIIAASRSLYYSGDKAGLRPLYYLVSTHYPDELLLSYAFLTHGAPIGYINSIGNVRGSGY